MSFTKRLYATSFLATGLATLGLVAYAKQTEKPVEELNLPPVLEYSISEQFNVQNSLIDTIHDIATDYSDLEAMYTELQQNYDLLQEQMEKLLSKPVFNPSDVTIVSNANVYQVKHALQETNLVDLASTFVEAEKTYHINAFFLIGLVCLESSYGHSDRAINDNNLSGYAVYNDYSVGRKFSSKHESIMETARLIAEDYLPDGAKFHTGKSIYAINQMYSADPNWNVKITNIANRMLDKARMWGVE